MRIREFKVVLIKAVELLVTNVITPQISCNHAFVEALFKIKVFHPRPRKVKKLLIILTLKFGGEGKPHECSKHQVMLMQKTFFITLKSIFKSKNGLGILFVEAKTGKRRICLQ